MTRTAFSCGAAAALVMLSAAPLGAADAAQRYAIDGPGRMDCARYSEIAAEGGGPLTVMGGWVAGYVTAHNRLAADTFDLTPWQSVDILLSQLRLYCAANPEARFETALQELVLYLAPDRVRTEEPLLSVGTGDQTVFLYGSTIDRARAILTDRGFENETDLSGALRRYQAANDLPQTGLLDERTLLVLFQGADAAAQ